MPCFVCDGSDCLDGISPSSQPYDDLKGLACTHSHSLLVAFSLSVRASQANAEEERQSV